ncbi:hypothetical protein Gpo141_00006331 [Globisporangium polare]
MSQLEASSSAHAATGNLVCGRCRRKTPAEAASKLCHACGTPLHASCSDDVAARECGLAFGFTAPAAFCSRRCYDSDLLANNQQQQVYQSQQQQKRLPHVPNEITAALTVKIGDVSKTSRKHVSVTTFRFLLSEGFEVFRAKTNSRTARELQQHASGAVAAESYVRDDRAVYIKPGVHSKQAELVELTEKNFEARIARSYRNFLKRKPVASSGGSGGASDAQFECDILTYVRKDSARRKQLALSSGGVKSTSRIHTFMEIVDHHSAAASMSSGAAGAGSGDLSGAASHKRKHAQLSDSNTANSSSTAAPFLSPQSESSAFQDPNQDPAYKTVRMLMNGQVVPVKVNVRDLLACFGMVHAVVDDASSSNIQEL